MTHIYISWAGPYTLKEVEELKNDSDYGIYQIYGTHPVYGSNVLLYIGKAEQQTFSKRIQQEENWPYNADSDNIQVYIGRLFDDHKNTRNKRLTQEQWNEMIRLAEKLLIYAHWPAGNSSNINTVSRKDQELNRLKDVRVFNYFNYRSLLPEVSGTLYVNEDDWDESSVFSMGHYAE